MCSLEVCHLVSVKLMRPLKSRQQIPAPITITSSSCTTSPMWAQ